MSWQEAHEDLLSTFVIRNIIMYTVVGAILLVASFGTYNIISTITHEKARDIAIMKSLGLSERTVRTIFVVEALIIGLAGGLVGFVLGYLLCLALGSIEFKSPFIDANRLPLVYSALALRDRRWRWRWSRRSRPATCRRARRRACIRSRSSGGRHERTATRPLIEARGVTRILPGIVPMTLVHDIDLAIGDNEFVAITGPSGSGKSSLLYLLGLLDLPTEGEVLIRGRATAHMSEEERAQRGCPTLGFVFQFHFLLPEFSALDNVMLPMRALGRLSREADARARRGAARLARPRRASAQAAGPAVRRPAPARRGRARARQRSAGDPGRRADRLARFQGRASRCSRSCAISSTGTARPWSR